jgi:hypothetical protein
MNPTHPVAFSATHLVQPSAAPLRQRDFGGGIDEETKPNWGTPQRILPDQIDANLPPASSSFE